jgi:hypothetical protein
MLPLMTHLRFFLRQSGFHKTLGSSFNSTAGAGCFIRVSYVCWTIGLAVKGSLSFLHETFH